MLSRRTFLFSAAAARSPRKILVLLIDGFGPEYLERSEMPHLRKMMAAGAFKIGKSVIPSVTNVNNASLVTGAFPAQHGITTNFLFDPATGASREMEDSHFLLRPTLFERARAKGWKTALVTAKDKVRTLCARGASIQISAEKPAAEWLAKIGPAEDMYSARVNYWTFRAARHVLKQDLADLLYLSTTDYAMHAYPPEHGASLEHLHTLDRLLAGIVDDHPGLELYLTADHGMNAKTEAIDPARVLAAKGISAEAVPIIRDKHWVHHGNLGGASYVYLAKPADRADAMQCLKETPGIEEIYDRAAAARLFRLRPDRIGDLFLLARKDVAVGNLKTEREPAKIRSHGSRHESAIPLIVHGARVDLSQYEYNLDLTRRLRLDRG